MDISIKMRHLQPGGGGWIMADVLNIIMQSLRPTRIVYLQLDFAILTGQDLLARLQMVLKSRVIQKLGHTIASMLPEQ